MPLWSPQAQFAGYYVALDKGIYARHGIDMTILKGGPGISPAQSLQNGTADFAVLWLSTALEQRDAGTRLVNVAQIIQRSSLMLIARKSSGIRTPADMQGRKVGLWGGDLALPTRSFFRKYGLHVREIPQSYTVNLFLRGGIDVASAMWYNEYHTILNSGINPEELQLFFLNEHGITFPEDGLYTLEDTYRADPARADAFAKASLEGWRYAFDHPEETLDIVIRHMMEAKIPANRAHQKWMLERMRDLILPQEKNGEMGRLKPADYAAVGATLRANGVIRSVPGLNAFIGRPDARK
jgi:NitT/TauT family transport system substrate-binding protein